MAVQLPAPLHTCSSLSFRSPKMLLPVNVLLTSLSIVSVGVRVADSRGFCTKYCYRMDTASACDCIKDTELYRKAAAATEVTLTRAASLVSFQHNSILFVFGLHLI